LDGAPVFLGQYLSGLELCTPLEEVKLYARALTLCSRVSGAKKVFFKPHPTFSTGLVHMVKNALQSASFELKILDSGTLMEEYLLYYRPAFLSSVFSTGLASAREIFGIDAYYFDTDAFIQKLKPYANSNRVPAALIRYGFPEIVVRSETMPLERLQEKLDLLAGGMQPKLLLRSLADKDALLGLPVDLDDEIEVGAREQIRKHIPPAAVDYSRCAVLELDLHASPLYAGVEPVDVPANVEEEERPAAKSERLFGEGKFEEAFFVSYAALKNTPMSTRHMRLLESSSEQLGGLFKHQCELIRPLHLQAVSEKEAAEALKLEQSGETQPLEQPAEAEKGGGGSVWSGFQKWLPVSRKDEGSPL
jgi:hypothetical protein